VLAQLDAAPQRSVALEDSLHGCAAAKAAGMFCVVVPNEVTRTQGFDHADLLVDSLADVSLSLLEAQLLDRGRQAPSADPNRTTGRGA
jgi:beta-phosphoglucomutase-like phosphatase (HAD superfamily)